MRQVLECCSWGSWRRKGMLAGCLRLFRISPQGFTSHRHQDEIRCSHPRNPAYTSLPLSH